MARRQQSEMDFGKVTAAGTSGYVGVDSVLRLINDQTLIEALVDPTGTVASGVLLFFIVSSFAYLAAVAGVIQFSGPRE